MGMLALVAGAAAEVEVELEVEPELVLVPVPVWTSSLAAEQVYLPLITPLLLSSWKGSQLKFPELTMLKAPLTLVREGNSALQK